MGDGEVGQEGSNQLHQMQGQQRKPAQVEEDAGNSVQVDDTRHVFWKVQKKDRVVTEDLAESFVSSGISEGGTGGGGIFTCHEFPFIS